MKYEKTERGFPYIEFDDRYEHSCSIQKSSLATEQAIWFGINDAEPKIMKSQAREHGIELDPREEATGWIEYPIPQEVSLTTRMHLTQDQVAELLPVLLHFAIHGELPKQQGAES